MLNGNNLWYFESAEEGCILRVNRGAGGYPPLLENWRIVGVECQESMLFESADQGCKFRVDNRDNFEKKQKQGSEKVNPVFCVLFSYCKTGRKHSLFFVPCFCVWKKYRIEKRTHQQQQKQGENVLFFFPIVLCGFVNLDKQGTNKKQGTEKWFGKNRAKKKTEIVPYFSKSGGKTPNQKNREQLQQQKTGN